MALRLSTTARVVIGLLFYGSAWLAAFAGLGQYYVVPAVVLGFAIPSIRSGGIQPQRWLALTLILMLVFSGSLLSIGAGPSASFQFLIAIPIQFLYFFLARRPGHAHEAVRVTKDLQRSIRSLDHIVQERTHELAESSKRYHTLFDDMNIAYAEQDISVAKQMIDQAKLDGATSFERLASEDPDFIDQCLAAVKVNRVNNALLHMMGYVDHDELIAKAPSENAVDARRVMMQQLKAIFEEQHHFTTTATLLGKDNRRVTVAVGVNTSPDWTISLSTHIDITERLRAQEMFAAARDDLARASRSLTIGAVSTSLAHELNQPLLALGVAAQTARRWLTKETPQVSEALQALERVTVNATRMNAIMQSTREKLLRRAGRLERLDLRSLIVDTERLLEPDLRTRNVILRVSCPSAIVLAERVEIQQVLINLIMNAADAMKDVVGVRIVRITVQRPVPGSVQVEISDNGSGISEDDLPHLFDPFFTTKSGGMGMGLRICRTIIEGFNGTIDARNSEDGGAVFRFVLPSPDSAEQQLA